MSKAVVSAFIDAINAQDVARIAGLCAADHRFVDARGAVVPAGELQGAWRGYFSFMPRYGIEVEEMVESGDIVVVFGTAWGELAAAHGGGAWRRPAAWRARVTGRQLSLWQVYVDTAAVFDLLAGR
jgi:ketosteroid isomerase-like protein